MLYMHKYLSFFCLKNQDEKQGSMVLPLKCQFRILFKYVREGKKKKATINYIAAFSKISITFS